MTHHEHEDAQAHDVPAHDVPAHDVPAHDVPAHDVPAHDVPAHDVQALSDVDVHVYEAVAAEAQGGGGADVGALCRATGLEEDGLRRSLATLVAHGYVVPQGDRVGLGPHTFSVETD
ncbi:hypothetical protein HTZ77_09060 [Nonomuraea sp. SMC257]|uniref:MarR family transcriptional regulator n=1 Tax=Nonomuraea montanisoli TaxID=2741721 RepID=A0A7Y6I4U7_9ACTN|nr:hypothetical protein [Nonomuraea montanisoli]NUW31574.1 hypothetical protein [Nonomuraea montanisoli]